MAIDHNIDVVADGFAHFGNARLGGLDGLETLDRHGRWDGHRLERCEAFRHRLPSKLAELPRVVDRRFVEMLHFSTAQMAVQADVVANRPSPKLVTRNAVYLPEDVPQGDVNSGNRRRSHNAAAVPKMLSPHHLPKMLDSTRILSNEQLRQIFDGSYHAARMPFQRCLA